MGGQVPRADIGLGLSHRQGTPMGSYPSHQHLAGQIASNLVGWPIEKDCRQRHFKGAVVGVAACNCAG